MATLGREEAALVRNNPERELQLNMEIALSMGEGQECAQTISKLQDLACYTLFLLDLCSSRSVISAKRLLQNQVDGRTIALATAFFFEL